MSRTRRPIALLVTALVAAPSIARADAGDLGKPPEELLRTFSADPTFLIPAAVLLALYLRGLVRLRRRGPLPRRVVRRSAALGLAVAACGAALCTPLDALGAALFTAHMVQHLVLICVVAPLAALARPGPVLAYALSSAGRRKLARVLRVARPLGPLARGVAHPASAFVLHFAAVWGWHLPSAYEAALLDDRVHVIEHASLLLTGWLFWRAIVVAGRRGEMGHGAAVLYAFAAALSGSALGAVLTSARAPWYRAHAGGPEGFGLTLLEDQHIAGLAMWIPAGVVYVAAAVLSFAAWLRAAEVASRAVDRKLSLSMDAEEAS